MPRPALWLVLLAMAVLPLAACGGETEATAAQDSTATALLRETFSNLPESGRIDLSAKGDGATLTVRGPFADVGARGIPRFALEATAEHGGRTLRAGATSIGDKGYVVYEGTAYEVPDQLFRLLRATLEARGGPTLGLDPTRWIRDPRVAGESGDGSARVIRITGAVDVPRLLADLQRLRRLAPGGPAPGMTARERRALARKVRNARVEVSTGAEDRRLRGLLVTAQVRGKGAVRLEVTLTKVGEPQTIEAPPDPQPFAELLQRFGARTP
jgi:hypothetical protein